VKRWQAALTVALVFMVAVHGILWIADHTGEARILLVGLCMAVVVFTVAFVTELLDI